MDYPDLDDYISVNICGLCKAVSFEVYGCSSPPLVFIILIQEDNSCLLMEFHATNFSGFDMFHYKYGLVLPQGLPLREKYSNYRELVIWFYVQTCLRNYQQVV